MAGRDTIVGEAPVKEDQIFATASSAQILASGTVPGRGTFYCLECGCQMSLREGEPLPVCPRCRSERFRRDSMFEPMQEHETTSEFEAPTLPQAPEWLREARRLLPGAGRYLACRGDCMGGDDDEIAIFPIEEGWTRVGRSVAADVRLDDPSVSRRHALLVYEGGQPLRVLDDRSLNGVYLNGRLVEWGRLADGDELTIGRYRLYVLEA